MTDETKGLSDGGTIDVLSVGYGDMTLSFNKYDPAEVAKAQQTITNMLRQGYALLVKMPDNTYQRVHAFDPETDSYVINEFVEAGSNEPEEQGAAESTKAPPKRGRGRPRKLARSETKATAVARSAGG